MSVGSSRAPPGPAAALRRSMTSSAIGLPMGVAVMLDNLLAGALRHPLLPVRQHPLVTLTSVHVPSLIGHCLSRMREEAFLHPQSAPYARHALHSTVHSTQNSTLKDSRNGP